jgi:DNA-binding NarL/FixJ family response regulator
MVAVERAVNGLMPRLRTAERKLVVAILTSRGWSSAAIAEHIGANSRTVQRDRAEQASARTGQ